MNSLRFIEKILIVLSIIGVIMKFTNSAGAEIFIVFPLLTLALIYFLFGFFIFRDRETKTNVGWKSVVAGMAFSFSLIGIVLKLEYEPLSEISLLIGIIGCISLMLIAMVRRKRMMADEPKQKYYFALINRCTIMIAFSALFFSIPQSSMIRFEFRNDPEFGKLMIDYKADPDNNIKRDRVYHYMIDMDDRPLQPGDSIHYKLKH